MKKIYDQKITEKAYDLFPEELFEPKFQAQIKEVYLTVMKGISLLCAPTQRFKDKKWRFVYRYILDAESGDEYKLQFSSPELSGVIEIIPAREPELKSFTEILKSYKPEGSSQLTLIAGIQPMSPKFFRRKIQFISLADYVLLLNSLFKSEYDISQKNNKRKKKPNMFKQIDNRFVEMLQIIETAKNLIFSRQSQDSLLIVEDNKVFRCPTVLKSDGAQFQKLIKFSKKIKKMLIDAAGSNPTIN